MWNDNGRSGGLGRIGILIEWSARLRCCLGRLSAIVRTGFFVFAWNRNLDRLALGFEHQFGHDLFMSARPSWDGTSADVHLRRIWVFVQDVVVDKCARGVVDHEEISSAVGCDANDGLRAGKHGFDQRLQREPGHHDEPTEANDEQDEKGTPEARNSEERSAYDPANEPASPRELGNATPPFRAVAREMHKASHRHEGCHSTDDKTWGKDVTVFAAAADDGDSHARNE